MTSLRKVMANRANARKSTGPKTCAGKARSSRNALRHGFGRPALCVGGYSGEVEVLARDIAGKDANDGRYELACRVAAAQLDLVQVRLAKRDLQTAANFGSLPGDCDSADHGSPDHGSPDWKLLLPIARLDRYEQRALTRRRRVIEDFIALPGEGKTPRKFCRTKPTGDNKTNSTSVPPVSRDAAGYVCKTSPVNETNPVNETAAISACARAAEGGVATDFCRTKPTGENPTFARRCSDSTDGVSGGSIVRTPATTGLADTPAFSQSMARLPLDGSKESSMSPAGWMKRLCFLLAGTMLSQAPALSSAFAADVTFERLVNVDKEPHNWLMNHRSYDGQRFSPLDRINKQNVKSMRLAYAVALGGSAVSENIQATPLVEDGFLYIVDQWAIVYKIDVRSGDAGRIVWRMDPKQEKPPSWGNRGVALWGNHVISVAGWPSRVIATNKDTGKVVWETNMQDQPAVELTAAPLVVKDRVVIGASGGDRGVRSWIAGLDAASGRLVWKKFTIPAPGEAGSETWKDKNNAWQTGGAAMWTTGTFDVASNQILWGTGNPVPMFDPTYRPGDNLYSNSIISWNPDDGRMNWYHQYLPNDGWDYDSISTHIIIDAQLNGGAHRLLTHSNRNGHVYTMESANGQLVVAKPYTDVNWTKGIDQKTGKPVEYVPNADRQIYAGVATATLERNTVRQCPTLDGGNNFWPSSYSPKTRLLYIPSDSGCNELKIDPSLSNPAGVWKGGVARRSERVEGDVIAFDPLTGDIRKKAHWPYAGHAGTVATAGGLIFTGFVDGTFAAFDDETLEIRWKINMGAGFTAPPITFAVDGKQYVAISTGLSRIARGTLTQSPEAAEMRNSTVLYVFTVD